MRPTVVRERLAEVTDSLSGLGLSVDVLRDVPGWRDSS